MDCFLPEMALGRRALPVVLTVGAGMAGYQYIYQSRHKEALHIYDGITIDQPWRVWLGLTLLDLWLWHVVCNCKQATIVSLLENCSLYCLRLIQHAKVVNFDAIDSYFSPSFH